MGRRSRSATRRWAERSGVSAEPTPAPALSRTRSMMLPFPAADHLRIAIQPTKYVKTPKLRPCLLLTTSIATLACTPAFAEDRFRQEDRDEEEARYEQTNLVSDIHDVAQLQD